MRALMLALTLLLGGIPAGAQDRPVPQLERVVNLPATVRLPVDHCSVPNMVAGLAKRFQLNAGIEFLPDDCPMSSPRTAPR